MNKSEVTGVQELQNEAGFSGLRMMINPKFRNLGIVLVLVVVLVLGALAFCAGKDPICLAIILFN